MSEKMIIAITVLAVIVALAIHLVFAVIVGAVIAFFTAWPMWVCVVIGYAGVSLISKLL